MSVNQGFYHSLDYIMNKMNQARDTKQSIITAVNSSEYIMEKIKRIEEKAWTEIKEEKEEKVENLHFEPNEIEPIMLKNEDRDEGR